MNSATLFAKTPPLKLFFIASVPGAISMLASALYQTIDGVFVGRFLGSTAFAAVNLAMPFVIINNALADLIGVGSSVPISISLGKKQEKEASNPASDPPDGSGRRIRAVGGAVSESLRDLFAGDDDRLCYG